MRARSTRLLTGRVTSIPATARLDADTGKYVYNGDLRAEVEADAVRRLHAGLLAGIADADDQCRPPLGPAHAVHAGDAGRSRRRRSRTCAASRASASGPGGRRLQHLQARHADRCSRFRPYDLFEPGDARLQHELDGTSDRTSASRGGRTSQSGFLRTLLGDPEQATLRAGYSLTYNQERIDRFTVNAGDNPGGTLNVVRNTTTGFPLVLPGETAPVLFRERNRLGPPTFPEAPEYPISGTTANNVEHLPGRTCATRGCIRIRSASSAPSARTWPSKCATSATRTCYHVGRGELERAEHRRERLPRRVPPRPGEPAVRISRRAADSRATRPARSPIAASARGTQPLPIHLAYLSGRRRRGQRRRRTRTRTFTNAAFLARFSAARAERDRARRSAIDTAANRALAADAGLPINFFMMNPPRRRHVHRRGPRLHQVQQPAGRTASPSVARTARGRQLHLRHPQGRRRTSRSTSTGWKSTTPTSRTRSRRTGSTRCRSAAAAASAPT